MMEERKWKNYSSWLGTISSVLVLKYKCFVLSRTLSLKACSPPCLPRYLGIFWLTNCILASSSLSMSKEVSVHDSTERTNSSTIDVHHNTRAVQRIYKRPTQSTKQTQIKKLMSYFPSLNYILKTNSDLPQIKHLFL